MTSKNNHKASSGGDNSNSHTPSWTNPSAAHMIQYGLQPLPDDFIPTPQEQVLIDMYGTMNQYERQAKRLREDAARRKLETSKAVFEQKQAASKNKNKRKRRSNATAEGGVTLGPSDDDNDDDTDMEDAEWDEENEEETAQSLHEKREAHLEVLRQEVEEKQNKEREEDLRRAAHLQEEEADEGLPAVVLQRKTKNANATQASSLIATLKAAATPLHEFSSAYELDNGEILYPKEGMGPEDFWSPPLEGPVSSPNEGALEVILDKFDLQLADNGTGPNTIGIKFKAPSDSKRFSINISVANEHNNFDSVLFHFNPRQHQKGGQLVINDKKEGQWGQAINIPLSQLPMIFGQTTSTLVIQINSEGFDVFIEKEHCARLEHRTSLPSGQTRLVMQFPSSDDSGSPERWNILKVFWGVRASLAKADLAAVAGVNIYRAEHPRKLIIRNLPKIQSVSDMEVRRAELERAFRKYGSDRGVIVVVPLNRSFAFVEMESERETDRALKEMGSVYQLGRARRSKHEALQEERAAKENGAASGGKTGAAKGWD